MIDQAEKEKKAFSQEKSQEATDYEEIMVMDNFSKKHEIIKVPIPKSGRGCPKSIEQKRSVKISELVDIVPMAKRP
jgi:Ca2+-dependent lipid-binding protein